MLFAGLLGKSAAGGFLEFKPAQLGIFSVKAAAVETDRLIIVFGDAVFRPQTAFFQKAFFDENIVPDQGHKKTLQGLARPDVVKEIVDLVPRSIGIVIFAQVSGDRGALHIGELAVMAELGNDRLDDPFLYA